MSVLLASFLLLIPILLLLRRRRKLSKRVPPGSLGIPIFGQSRGLLRAMRANTAEKWIEAMETLRVFPPIFGGFRKAVTDIEYGGYLIPEGWQIFWVTAMTRMDNSVFPEPSKFDPSRFENQASIPPYCFIPFEGGARICPGYEFAKIETLVAIHYLVTRFCWKPCADNFFIRDPMPVPTQGLPVEIWPRKLS